MPPASRSWSLLAVALACACGSAVPTADFPSPPTDGTGDGPPAIAAGEYLVRLPFADGRMRSLTGQVTRAGLAVAHVYSDAVGLGDTLAIRGSAEAVAGLAAGWPGLDVRPAVLRYPSGCGDGTCSADEAAGATTGSTCSVDCGVPGPRERRPERGNSAFLDVIGATGAWASGRGAGVTVCILDSGYDRGPASTHPDRPLSLLGGYDFPDGNGDFSAQSVHGTHVAGIVAAPENGIGMVGVAPEAGVRIYGVFKTRLGRLGASDADILAALDAALADGCRVINMSFGGGLWSDAEHRAIQALYASGVLLVAAAGNSEDAASGNIRTATVFPAAYPEVLAVGATRLDDTIAGFSSTGPVLSLSAPGVAIYSSLPVGQGDREVALSCRGTGPGFALASFTPPGSSGTAVADLPLVDCGYGSAAECVRCQPVGRLALIHRGPAGPGSGPAIPFADKLRNARQAGAAGVLLYNHRFDPADGPGGPLTNIDIGGGVPVPVATLAAGDGEYLAGRLGGGEALRCSVTTSATSWGVLDGTSMAAPMVSGVAALLLSTPAGAGLSNVALRQLLAESAVDLGAPGRDDAYGWGRVDAGRALAQGRPVGRCGDGRIDPASELCDGTAVAGAACEDRGFDGVAGGAVVCNAGCSGLDDSGCRCLPGRPPFDVRVKLLHDYLKGSVLGTLAFYQVSLAGQPVRGAFVRASLQKDGREVATAVVGPSNGDGTIAQFVSTIGNRLPSGDYTVVPTLTKAAGRCHDDQALSPFVVPIKN